jgi:hypothetical protein
LLNEGCKRRVDFRVSAGMQQHKLHSEPVGCLLPPECPSRAATFIQIAVDYNDPDHRPFVAT